MQAYVCASLANKSMQKVREFENFCNSRLLFWEPLDLLFKAHHATWKTVAKLMGPVKQGCLLVTEATENYSLRLFKMHLFTGAPQNNYIIIIIFQYLWST